MVTRDAFLALVALVAVQRLLEVVRSRRHQRALLARGGRVHAQGQMRWMQLLHGAWLLAMVVEVLFLRRPFVWPLAVVALGVFATGQALRLLAQRALGARWTVTVVTLPGAPPVTGGIYRYLRHPNYLGVILEIAALPLVHTAWITSVVFTVLDGWMLRRRIRAEERALAEDSDYARAMAGRARLVPRGP